jgi:hypothetical protein
MDASLSFVNFVKPDYAVERSWQQSGHCSPSMHLAICSRGVRESAGFPERTPLHAQTIASRNPGSLSRVFSYVAKGEVKG